MSLDMLGSLNWLAVIAAAIVYFVLGAIWFQRPVLGNIWIRSIGYDISQGLPGANPLMYLPALVAYLVIAIVTAMIASATGASSIGDGVTLGLVLGIGYGLTLYAVEAAFSPTKPEPWTWFVVSGGYHLIGLFLTAVIVSAWV